MNGISQTASQYFAGVFKNFKRDGIILHGCIVDHFRGQVIEGNLGQKAFAVVLFGQQFQNCSSDSSGRTVGFEMAFGSATTLASIRYCSDMSQLSGKSVVAIDQITIDDNAAAKTGTQCDHDKIAHTDGTSVDHLSQCSRVGIVGYLDDDVFGQLSLDEICEVNNCYKWQIGGDADGTVVIIGIGRPDTDSHHLQV